MLLHGGSQNVAGFHGVGGPNDEESFKLHVFQPLHLPAKALQLFTDEAKAFEFVWRDFDVGSEVLFEIGDQKNSPEDSGVGGCGLSVAISGGVFLFGVNLGEEQIGLTDFSDKVVFAIVAVWSRKKSAVSKPFFRDVLRGSEIDAGSQGLGNLSDDSCFEIVVVGLF